MMAPRRSKQEWTTLLQQCEESPLSIKAFCRQHHLATSVFYAKRKQLKQSSEPQVGAFVRAKVTECAKQHHATPSPLANLSLSLGEIELSIPQGTPTTYLAALIEALRS